MMEDINAQSDFSFTKVAIYKIVVKGEINDGWLERMWGFHLSKDKKKKGVSVIVGQIADQSALSGILNTLYDKHMTVISVNMLSEIEKQ